MGIETVLDELRRLIAAPTIAGQSNVEFVADLASELEGHGAVVCVTAGEQGRTRTTCTPSSVRPMRRVASCSRRSFRLNAALLQEFSSRKSAAMLPAGEM